MCTLWYYDTLLTWKTLFTIYKTFVHVRPQHRDILLEATSSQKLRATKESTGDQGGGPLSVIDPQCYRVWNEIEIFQMSDKNIYSALNHCCNRL